MYNRGVDKRVIFTSPEEYRRFMGYLYLLNTQEVVRPGDIFEQKQDIYTRERESPMVAIGAYCLMPNHFHLYVTPLVDGGISKFMQRLQTAYTMYFNEKHKRSGSLFQGTFKAEHIERDQYAKYLFSYIHLNPAKLKDKEWKVRGARELAGMRKFLEEYPYSSLQSYVLDSHTITDPTPFPAYLSRSRDLRDHIVDWLRHREAKPHGDVRSSGDKGKG